MEGLKIALVSDWFLPTTGGIEYHIHDLAVLLTRRGYQVLVITRNGKYPDDLLPYNVYRIKGKLNLEHYKVSIGLKELKHLLAKEKFHIVHSHSIYSPMALTSSLLSRSPNLITNHSLMGRSYMNIIYRPILRKLCGKVQAFICVSRAVERDTKNIFKGCLKKRPVYVVPNGIDTEYWRPSRQREKWKGRLGLDGTIVTICARLTARKRLELIPKIARALAEQGTRGVKFLIIGDGSKKAMIRNLIKANNVEDLVIMIGRKPREKVREYLWASDIYLSPAIYEAFGIAILEALSCGVPVVANNHGGTADLVKHGKGGLIARDDTELIDCLISLINNRNIREEMSRNARQETVKHFAWDKIMPKLLAVYSNVLNPKEIAEQSFLISEFSAETTGELKTC